MPNEAVPLITSVSAVIAIPVLLAFLVRQARILRQDPVLFRTRLALSAWLVTVLSTAVLQARAQGIVYMSGDLPNDPWLSLLHSGLRLTACGLTLWAFVWRRKY